MRLFSSLLLIAVLLACSGKKNTGPPPAQPVSVDVIVASETDIREELEANGTVLSAEMVELHVESGGRLTVLDMKDGAFVKKGTLLAKVNDADLQARLRHEQIQLDLARKNKDRFEKMLAVNGVNQADYDKAVADVAAFEAAADMTRAQIEKTEVRAPFDGTLGLRMVSPGAYVTPQTDLGTIVENGPLRIDFTVPEDFADRLKTGRPVEVIAASGDTIPATLTAVEPQINTTTRNLKARATVNSGRLTPGAFVKVSLQRTQRGIAMPAQCIIPDAVASRVIVVREGKGRFVAVKTGIRTEESVEITDGLASGDTVVVTGVLFVRPNADVKVRSVKSMTVSSR
jgi:membrane fusion protein (multidrug efflux system)